MSIASTSVTSGRRAARSVVTDTAFVAVLSALVVASLVVGSSSLTPADVVATLFGQGDAKMQLIVFELRMPRVAAALVVGLCLGMAGALAQGFARNPLASPDILGVTSGASLGAVAAIVLGGGTYAVASTLSSIGIPLAAIVGALAASAAVYGLAWRDGVESYRLILIGIGATATLGGITSFLVARAQITDAAQAAQWMVGSLSGVSWASVWPAALALLILAPVALSQSRNLDIAQLGDELTVGLGVRIQLHRLLLLFVATVLTAVAVSASGPVEFVAFVAPQIARRVARVSRPPLLASALMGAIIVLGGDSFARAVAPGLPVGVITVIVGAPYLIWLLIRGRQKETTA